MWEGDWQAANRASWDERVAVHLGPGGYDLAPLRAGRGRLHPIEEAELGPVEGLRILHLQCHFGHDSLTLAQRGADVVGLDFSTAAIEAARALTTELGLGACARFVEADLYAAREAIPEPAAFDLVFVTWGAIGWLPDIRAWAGIVAGFLKPGGALFLAEGHPAALVLDDAARREDGMPGLHVPYFLHEPYVEDVTQDYACEAAVLTQTRNYTWLHPLAEVITALLDAGLTLRFLHEHDRVPWRMFQCLQKDADGMFGWPDRPWLPLAYSLRAARPLS